MTAYIFRNSPHRMYLRHPAQKDNSLQRTAFEHSIQRALDTDQRFIADVQIDFGRPWVAMTEEGLDETNLHAIFHEMSRKSVPQAVRRYAFRYGSLLHAVTELLLYAAWTKIVAGPSAGKQDACGLPAFLPVFSQSCKSSFRQNDIAILTTLGFADMDV